MAIIITVEDVKSTCPTSLSDEVIERLICMVQDKIGQCVEDSYSECTGENILIFAVCHFIQSMAGGYVKSKRGANGAQITYNETFSGEGLQSTPFGRLLIQIDTSLCYQDLVDSTVLFLSIGNPTTPCSDLH